MRSGRLATWWLINRLFLGEGVRTARFGQVHLLSLVDGANLVGLPISGRSLAWLCRLFFADGLKLEGFHESAEAILRDLARTGASRSVALLALADLLLLHALWSQEFQTYYARGNAVDIDDGRAPELRSRSWRTQRFSEARDILQQLHQENAYPSFTRRLLSECYAATEAWPELSDMVSQATTPTRREMALSIAASQISLDAASSSSGWQVVLDRLEYDSAAGHGRLLVPAESLRVDITLVQGGRSFRRSTLSTFPAGVLRELPDALVLAPYGLVVSEQQVVADEFHLLPIHHPPFCGAVEAVGRGHAVLSPASGSFTELRQAIYIGASTNYFHFLIEDLPRVRHVIGVPSFAPVPILVDVDAPSWCLTLLDKAGVPGDRRLEVDLSHNLKIDRLVLPPRLSKYQICHPADVAWLTETLTPPTTGAIPGQRRRFYLKRGPGAGRRLLNESRIEKIFRDNGFEIIDPGAMSIDQQISLFRQAEIVAGPGGAAFANIVFAPERCKIIMLSAEDILTETYSSLAASRRQMFIWCIGKSLPRSHRYWIWTRFNFFCEETDVRLAIKLAIDRGP